MDRIERRGYSFSALTVGTVQWGLQYGLNTNAGKTPEDAAFRMLDCAVASGVNWLDTAQGYGDAERVIGQWRQQSADKGKLLTATKISRLDHGSPEALRRSVYDKVRLSKQRLNAERIDLLMLHDCDEFFADQDRIMQVFRELKEEGEILFSGVSAYSHHDYFRIAGSGLDAVQIPLNPLDWRQIVNGGIEALDQANMIVFARSVFLQGLVFRTAEQLSENMQFAADAVNRYHSLCGQLDMTAGKLAVSFVRSIPGITSLAIGCRNEEQLTNTLSLLDNAPPLTTAEMKVVFDQLGNTDERVVTPSLWLK